MTGPIIDNTHVIDSHAIDSLTGLGGVTLGLFHWFDMFQNVIVSVGAIAGAILVIWRLVDRVREKLRQSRRKTDVRETDK